jgi:hypothetical protein
MFVKKLRPHTFCLFEPARSEPFEGEVVCVPSNRHQIFSFSSAYNDWKVKNVSYQLMTMKTALPQKSKSHLELIASPIRYRGWLEFGRFSVKHQHKEQDFC